MPLPNGTSYAPPPADYDLESWDFVISTGVRAAIEQYFPEPNGGGSSLLPAFECALSLVATMAFAGRVKPITVIFEGSSGCGKTEICQSFFDATVPVEVEGGGKIGNYIYRSESFTAASFVTHAPTLESSEARKADLLPKLKNKLFVVKEMSPLFTADEKELKRTFGNLTSILDGLGYTSDSGSKGSRGYDRNILFNWLGATTPVSDRVHQLIAQCGTRMLFYELQPTAKTKSDLVRYCRGGRKQADVQQGMRTVVNRCILTFFALLPVGSLDQEVIEIPDAHAEELVDWCQLLCYGRRKVDHSKEDGLIVHPPEDSHKVIDYFKDLARGHALIHGRFEVNADDMHLISHIALSSIPGRIRPIVRMLREKGTARTSDMRRILGGVSAPTARRRMEEVEAIGIGVYSAGSTAEAGILRLAKQFDWLQKR